MPLSGHDDIELLKDVANGTESAQKSIITSYSQVLRVYQLGKLLNRIPGSHLLISSVPGSASRTLVESLSKPCNVNKCSQSLAW